MVFPTAQEERATYVQQRKYRDGLHACRTSPAVALLAHSLPRKPGLLSCGPRRNRDILILQGTPFPSGVSKVLVRVATETKAAHGRGDVNAC